MTHKELRKEFQDPAFRKAMVECLGASCVNCGATEFIEYHHIVPLTNGGTNRISNIVPLCQSCHAKAHGKVWKGKNFNAGRPRKVKLDETTLPVMDAYFACEIGQKEAYTKLGMCQDAFIKLKKLYKESHAVPDGFFNDVDLRAAKNR